MYEQHARSPQKSMLIVGVDTQTPLLSSATKLIPPDAMQGLHALHPFKGLGQAEDIAKAALFLASEDASWVTGHCLAVDGGFTAR